MTLTSVANQDTSCTFTSLWCIFCDFFEVASFASAYCIDIRHFECIHMYKYRQHSHMIVRIEKYNLKIFGFVQTVIVL